MSTENFKAKWNGILENVLTSHGKNVKTHKNVNKDCNDDNDRIHFWVHFIVEQWNIWIM